MGRAVRYLIYGIGAVVALLLAVIAAVAVLVEPDDYRDEIAAAVRKATGRELTLGGPLGLGLFPCCSLSLADASLGNPPGFPEGPFVAVRSASLGFRIWPLLTERRLSVHQITITGLEANLLTDAAGRSNWTFDGADEAATPAEAGGADAVQLELAGITLREGALTWQDARDATDYAVAGLDLETGPLQDATPVPVTASFGFTDRSDGTTGDLKLTATASVDLDGSRATLAGPAIDLTLRGPALPFGEAVLKVGGGDLQVDFGDASRMSQARPVIDAVLRGGELPFAEGTVALTGESLQVDYGEPGRATFTAPAIDAQLKGGDTLPGDTAVKLTAQQLVVEYAAEPLVTAFIEVTGDIKAAGGNDWPAIQGQFGSINVVAASGEESTRLQVPALRTLLTVSGDAVPGGKADVEATVVGLDMVTEPLLGRFERLAVKLAGSGASAEITGAGRFGDRNDLAGTFTLAQVSPKELLTKLAPPAPVTTDPQALTALAGSGQWALRGEVVSLDGLRVTLDDSKVTGSLSRTLGEQPRTRFDLVLDRIDLDRYLEPEATAAAASKPAGDQPTELPVSMIRDLRLDGRARVGQLAYDGLKLTDVDVTVAADGGRLRLDPLRTQLYGGSLAGSIVVDATGDLARVSVRQQVRDLQLGPFLTDFADVRNITGRVVADLDLAGSGATDADIKRSLDGRVSLGLAEGLYKGVDLWYEIRRGQALLRQDAAPARTGEAATPLKVVELAGPVAGGVLTSEKFVAEIPFLRLAGKLRLDMPAEQIRGDLQASVFETPTFEDGTSLPDLVGSRLPLTLDGPLSSPKVRVDFSKMVREAVKETAKEQLKGLQDKMLERVGLGAPAPPPAGDQAAPGTEPAQAPDGGQPPADQPPKKKESSGDRLRKGLEKLIKPTE
jgi:AsmA protein